MPPSLSAADGTELESMEAEIDSLLHLWGGSSQAKRVEVDLVVEVIATL